MCSKVLKEMADKVRKAATTALFNEGVVTFKGNKSKEERQAKVMNMIQALGELHEKLEISRREVVQVLRPGVLVTVTTDIKRLNRVLPGFDELITIVKMRYPGPLSLDVASGVNKAQFDPPRDKWTTTIVEKGDILMFLGYFTAVWQPEPQPLWLMGKEKYFGWLFLDEIEVKSGSK